MSYRTKSLTLIFILFIFSASFSQSNHSKLTKADSSSLKALSGIIQLYKYSSDEIWPSYDLSKRDFIFYLPDRWALFVNRRNEVEEFEPYPQDWPDIGTSSLFHNGKYDNLIGQLAFKYEIDSLKTVAIGLPLELLKSFPNPEEYLFGFIIHEAFHQFQYDSFADIPWAREEKYPILNRENIAYAYIEMQLLVDAINSAYENKLQETEKYLKQFAAIRNYRWNNLDSFIKKFEQGLEIREGTAQYVQMKSFELFKKTKKEDIKNGLALDFYKDIASVSMPAYLIDDFKNRYSNHTISPDDMARNRIYPVGSALGLLSDFLNIEWKEKAQYFPQEFEFVTILNDYFNLKDDDLVDLLHEAKYNYNFDKVVSSTDRIVETYINEYQTELDSFNSQSGIRIEISFRYKGISRSRSTREKKWHMEAGKISFCKRYNLYKLNSKNLSFSLKNSGLYEDNNWDIKSKRLIFYTSQFSSLRLNNKNYDISRAGDSIFNQIEFKDDNFDFSYIGLGKISRIKQRIIIELE